MSKCSQIFRHIYHSDCKIIMFKVEKQDLFRSSKAEISSLANFQKICLYFLVCRSSLYGSRLSLGFTTKNYK